MKALIDGHEQRNKRLFADLVRVEAQPFLWQSLKVSLIRQLRGNLSED